MKSIVLALALFGTFAARSECTIERARAQAKVFAKQKSNQHSVYLGTLTYAKVNGKLGYQAPLTMISKEFKDSGMVGTLSVVETKNGGCRVIAQTKSVFESKAAPMAAIFE